jgi:hypothetical protein
MLAHYVVRSPQTMEEAPVPIRSPGHHIDPDHRGPIIDILVWICFVFSSLAIVSKIILKVGKRTRYFRWSRLQVDDGAILVALAFSTAYSVCVSQQVRYGLGSHVNTLSPQSLATSQKVKSTSLHANDFAILLE